MIGCDACLVVSACLGIGKLSYPTKGIKRTKFKDSRKITCKSNKGNLMSKISKEKWYSTFKGTSTDI